MDSRVVRIELRNPPPPVNFSEWDGLIRLLFNRKHKKLHSVLTTKSVLQVRSDSDVVPLLVATCHAYAYPFSLEGRLFPHLLIHDSCLVMLLLF